MRTSSEIKRKKSSFIISVNTPVGILYKEQPFKWNINSASTKVLSLTDLDKICASCESVKDTTIKKLKNHNTKLKKLITFLRNEIATLELKTAATEKSIPLDEIVKELTSTPKGKKAWDEAWQEQHDEWKALVESGKISRIKYFRLINSMDQATLAKKLETAQPNISRIEKLGYNVPVKTLEKLSKIFKVKKGDLIGD